MFNKFDSFNSFDWLNCPNVLISDVQLTNRIMEINQNNKPNL
jgi:hypothetical protein